VTTGPSRPTIQAITRAGVRWACTGRGPSQPRGPGAEVNVIAMLGGVLSALTGHASWQAFALLPDGKPGGLMALAAVTLTCLLVALLAQGARLAAAVTAVPQRSGVAALREKSWRAGFISQRDPDAPGRARPRAPTAGPAAA
jgi:hypothetical protein